MNLLCRNVIFSLISEFRIYIYIYIYIYIISQQKTILIKMMKLLKIEMKKMKFMYLFHK